MSARAASMTPNTAPDLGPLTELREKLRGRLTPGASLAEVTWFRVGGPAAYLFKPADLEDLQTFLRARPPGLAVLPLGVGSNILVRDGGIDGVVLRFGRAFATIEIQGETVIAGAGALDLNVALSAREAGLAGLEFLSGIPGTIGGALRMNAGAYGREVKDVLLWAEALRPDGSLVRLVPADMGLSYRHAGLPGDWIFVRAAFTGTPGDKTAIARAIQDIQAKREESQPIKARTGGSTFKNPPGFKAWEVIDKAGCRGLVLGDAQVSEKHCNFLINRGAATASELEALGEEVRRRVQETQDITLEWEIKRLGKASSEEGARG